MDADVAVDLVVDAIKAGATMAGQNVFDPRSWPTELGDMPIVLVEMPSEEKAGHGRSGAPMFTGVVTVPVIGRLTAKALAGDAAAPALRAALGVLQRQIERAVVNDYALRRAIQKHAFIRAKRQVSAEGEQLVGQLAMEFGLEIYQGPEDFHPVEGEPLEELAIYADLLNVFSPTGDFAADPHATPWVADAEASPRDTGPDGRAEGAFVVTLPPP